MKGKAYKIHEIPDDKSCVLCGSKNNLVVHHIWKVSQSANPRCTPNNSILLCNRCHSLVENHPERLLLNLIWIELKRKHGVETEDNLII